MVEKKKVGDLRTLAQYGLVVLMIGAAFWTGTLYSQVKILTGGGSGSSVSGTTAAGGSDADAPAPLPAQLTGDDWQELLDNPAATLGDKNAPVTLVEFTDYQCPFCQRAFQDTFPQIKANYIDTGDVFYVVRDLPLAFHNNAEPTALAARCAGDQGKYFEMHDKLFEAQDEWSVGNPDEKLKGYAQEMGLNSGQFNSCYDGGKYDSEIQADLALANKVGATGTPTFFINGTQVVGAQPFAAFETVIEEELNK